VFQYPVIVCRTFLLRVHVSARVTPVALRLSYLRITFAVLIRALTRATRLRCNNVKNVGTGADAEGGTRRNKYRIKYRGKHGGFAATALSLLSFLCRESGESPRTVLRSARARARLKRREYAANRSANGISDPQRQPPSANRESSDRERVGANLETRNSRERSVSSDASECRFVDLRFIFYVPYFESRSTGVLRTSRVPRARIFRKVRSEKIGG